VKEETDVKAEAGVKVETDVKAEAGKIMKAHHRIIHRSKCDKAEFDQNFDQEAKWT
jgi:hypothetical protein